MAESSVLLYTFDAENFCKQKQATALWLLSSVEDPSATTRTPPSPYSCANRWEIDQIQHFISAADEYCLIQRV